MPKIDREIHEIDVRSYELDSYAHVNNGAYIGWFENGRERVLRRAGHDYAFYPQKCDAHFVVVHIDCDFKSAAHAGDRIRVVSRIAKIGRTSVTFRQTAIAVATSVVHARARTVMAFSGPDQKSTPVPTPFLENFAVSAEGDLWTDIEGGERA
jgi:YbgC/YbaW family acyl-CoA thioester hydrolase